MKYSKTKWIDSKTPVNAQNLNKIENAIEDLYDNSFQLEEGDGIQIDSENGNVKISVKPEYIKSTSCEGIEWVNGELEEYEDNKLYFVIDPSTEKLSKIVLSGITIFEV